MKKFLFLLMLLPATLCAQTSICGVKFGTSYSEAESVLENKFGDKVYFLSDKTQIVFEDKMYAGIIWDRMFFCFQSDGYTSYLNRCILVINCKSADEAKKKRDAIKKQMDDKYIILPYTDEKTGFKFYLGGISPTDETKAGFSIDIIKYNNGTYGARLDYSPYNYVIEEL